MNKLIGIYGGTFDPIHYGHLRPALDILQVVGLDEVRFIPNRLPPHRQAPILDDQQRAELVGLAIAGTPEFILDRRELKRVDGPSYMIDTLKSLRADFQDSTLCLIMGIDAFNGLPQWRQWESILNLCHIIVSTRPGCELADFAQRAPFSEQFCTSVDALKQRPSGQILLQSVTQLDISASLIRNYLLSGQSTRYLLPEIVREKLEQAYVK